MWHKEIMSNECYLYLKCLYVMKMLFIVNAHAEVCKPSLRIKTIANTATHHIHSCYTRSYYWYSVDIIN